jgi:molybdopterin/thiamine biosynthesis adenylyltransferase/rhodanese-related sulfurtransferase
VSTHVQSAFDRYSRQTRLPQVGHEGQTRLAHSHVVIVGLGGLGSPAAHYLAGAGIGRLTLVDQDDVALHNLHRQTFYTEADVGQSKSATTATRLKQLNSDIQVQSVQERLKSSNLAEIMADASLVLDAADNFAVTYLLSDYCRDQGLYLVSASAQDARGYVGVFCGPRQLSHRPSYRALFPELPSSQDNCNTVGIFGPVAGALGCMQAQQALSILLESEMDSASAPSKAPSKSGQLNSWDFYQNRFNHFSFAEAPEPDNAKSIAILEQADGDLLTDDLVIDVRPESERQQDPVKGAISIEAFEKLESGKPSSEITQRRWVFVCKTGIRAYREAFKWSQEPGLQTDLAILLR